MGKINIAVIEVPKKIKITKDDSGKYFIKKMWNKLIFDPYFHIVNIFCASNHYEKLLQMERIGLFPSGTVLKLGSYTEKIGFNQNTYNLFLHQFDGKTLKKIIT